MAALARHGLEDDLDLALAIGHAPTAAPRIGVDAALLIHEHGRTEDDARAYLERWGLRTPARAAHGVRFVTDPTWRAYVITYSAGRISARRTSVAIPRGSARLLTEQVRVADLLAARA